MIIGVDEVGRGSWAGPLCVAAVILGDVPILGLDDSKKLTHKRRLTLAAEIRKTARGIGVGWVSAKAIDRHGISAALKSATLQAIAQVTVPFEEIIIDGTVNFIGDKRVTAIPKADSLVPSVSAASIVAKVARDHYMHMVDTYFTHYQFAKHVGYGTKLHRQLLEEYGPSAIHRMSFSPMNDLQMVRGGKTTKPKILTAGSLAEEKAAIFLAGKGFDIIEKNWRTRWCEIDIVARKNNTIYLVEVKYRKQLAQGSGLEYITKVKQQQMAFAAEFWVHKNKWPGDYRLAAVEITGSAFTVSAWLDNLLRP